MLTIFSCPKPFTDKHINLIQRNAIKSWTLLRPTPEIFLLGNEEGTKEICKEYGLIHIPHIKYNKYGTPILNSIFEEAEKRVTTSIMCYVNADIILLNDFIEAVIKVKNKFQNKFLMIGRRWDVDIKNTINYNKDWKSFLRNYVLEKGKLHSHTGIDFFVFHVGNCGKLPPFFFARTMWDNWLIYKFAIEGIPVIDASDVVTVIHQNHDYSHQRWKDPFRNPEAKYNFKLCGGSYVYAFTIKNATYKLTKKGFKTIHSSFIYILFMKVYSLFPQIEPFMRILRWLKERI